MNDQRNATLWDDFFGLATVGDLKNFWAHLDLSVPKQVALSYYISTRSEEQQGADAAVFLPGQMISRDRSAVMYNSAPVVFEGTNRWSWKTYSSTAELSAKLNWLANVVAGIRDWNPDERMTLVLIPEKDHFIISFLLREDRFASFEAAVDELTQRMMGCEVHVVCRQPFNGIDRFLSLADFEYPGSHLAGRNYVTVFGYVLEILGVSRASIKDGVGLRKLPEFSDLATKFDSAKPTLLLTLRPDVLSGATMQVAGSETFAEPLGKTWQEFRNEAAPVDQSVHVLGDSHYSIYSQRKLGYLFANTFRDTHFEWNPCGIQMKSEVTGYDNVVLEISSRFVV